MDPLTTLVDLQAAIDALPPVAPNKVRIFRGQGTDYPSIIPAGFRNRLDLDAVWKFYSTLLLLDLSGATKLKDLQGEYLQVFGVWLDAIAQHYGSGSRYLDVTHSIECAAWFALHKAKSTAEQSLLGPPGLPCAFDMPSTVTWLDYSRATEPGFLYAFDVDLWDGISVIPPDLGLIDLSRAPAPFCTPRMLVQVGSLIRAGSEAHQDLRPFRVEGTPLPIAWPMAGSAIVQRSVEEMFPLPTEDAWYRRFLSIPMSVDVDPASNSVVLKRAIPVTLYRGETTPYNAALTGTECFLYPPLLHRVMKLPAVPAEAEPQPWWDALRITDATSIVLEAPLLRAFSPADSSNWNHELLLGDSVDSVPTFQSTQDEVAAETTLLNVLLQFTHLEEIFWERAIDLTAPVQLTRGLWMRRQGDELVVMLLTQDFPALDLKPWAEIIIRLDKESRRMQFQTTDGAMPWTPLTDVNDLAKPVFIALYLLRALSPKRKVEAFAALFSHHQPGTPDAEYDYLPRVHVNVAKLIRHPDPDGRDWFVMRDENNQPYAEAHGAGLSFKDTRVYADIPAEAFRKALIASGGLTPEEA